MKNNQPKSKNVEVLNVPKPGSGKAEFRDMGGGSDDSWNRSLTDALCRALPTSHAPFNPELRMKGKVAALVGISDLKPADPIEGMIISQIVAANATGLELQRRAWLENQTYEARTRFLALADKSARTVATLVEALNRHRGKGQQQIVRVERVTVNEGGQAIVGAVTQGGGHAAGNQIQPHAPFAPVLGQFEAQREGVPVASG